MKQKITFLLLLFACYSGLVFGQTMVDDFESGAGGLLSNAGGITTAVVANPNPTGLNTTANCLEIKRTAAQWWILGGVNVAPDLTISNTGIKYLSMMVHFPAQPDLGCRFDGPDDATNGGGSSIVRALNSYTTPNQWQQIVFEIKDNQAATSFSHGTMYRVDIHPDMGFENDPVGQVLDAAGTIAGYIDQIQVLDAIPLSTKKFELEKNISLHPSPAQSSFKITTRNNVAIENVSVYTLLGKQIQNIARISTNEYDISGLASGLYIVKMIDSNGVVASKKLLKN